MPGAPSEAQTGAKRGPRWTDDAGTSMMNVGNDDEGGRRGLGVVTTARKQVVWCRDGS